MESAFWFFDRFGDARTVMRMGRQTLPEPGPGQAVVRLRAVGLNQADNRYLRGTHFPPKTFPSCLSHEAIGEIVALGPGAAEAGVSHAWAVGDRVAFVPMLVDTAGMGVLRDVGLYDLASFLPVPPAYSDREGAAYWMAVLTMAGAMQLAGLGPGTSRGRRIAFTAAAGGMGTLALKLARAWGAEAMATTRSAEKVAPLSALAARVAVVRTAGDLAAALRAWSTDGVDAVIDPLGGAFVGAAVEALAPGGRYVSYEWRAGTTGTYDVASLIAADASLHGFTIFRLLRHPGLLEQLTAIGMDHADRLTPLLADDYGFDAAPDAFEALARGRHVGKITVSL
jgi:NADPH:quinone reductase-like Zn-dependent oxidoreductase